MLVNSFSPAEALGSGKEIPTVLFNIDVPKVLILSLPIITIYNFEHNMNCQHFQFQIFLSSNLVAVIIKVRK